MRPRGGSANIAGGQPERRKPQAVSTLLKSMEVGGCRFDVLAVLCADVLLEESGVRERSREWRALSELEESRSRGSDVIGTSVTHNCCYAETNKGPAHFTCY